MVFFFLGYLHVQTTIMAPKRRHRPGGSTMATQIRRDLRAGRAHIWPDLSGRICAAAALIWAAGSARSSAWIWAAARCRARISHRICCRTRIPHQICLEISSIAGHKQIQDLSWSSAKAKIRPSLLVDLRPEICVSVPDLQCAPDLRSRRSSGSPLDLLSDRSALPDPDV
ncbi:Uncharacterized protein Adt_28524 [Abeliophyllum distichum]|uniref:Uncharacterized protein n=1 Tax=Abeliophyllum distichum TaxID=126358 RepID=A0ABD1RWS6_9LAMI